MNVPKYAKAAVAFLGALAAAASVAISDGVVDPAEWVTIVLAGLTAVGVYVVPNRQEPVE